MPLDLVVNLVTSLIELLRLSILLAIPFLIFGTIIRFITGKLRGKLGISFVYASFAATYVVVLLLITFAYFAPLYAGYAGSPFSVLPKPPQLAITQADVLAAAPGLATRTLWLSLIFSFFLFPLEFVASFAAASLGEKYALPSWGKIVAGSLAAAILTLLLVLFLFPFSISGLIYLVYFG